MRAGIFSGEAAAAPSPSCVAQVNAQAPMAGLNLSAVVSTKEA